MGSLQHGDAFGSLRTGECSSYGPERFPSAHHAIDLSFLLHPPAFQRLLLQRPLRRQYDFFGALRALAIDAGEEEDESVHCRMDGVVEPVPRTWQVVERKGGGTATGAMPDQRRGIMVADANSGREYDLRLIDDEAAFRACGKS